MRTNQPFQKLQEVVVAVVQVMVVLVTMQDLHSFSARQVN